MTPEQMDLVQLLDKMESEENVRIEVAQQNIVRIEDEREKALEAE